MEYPDIKINGLSPSRSDRSDIRSPVPEQESPPLPFKKPLLKSRHSSPGQQQVTLKKDVENAPPCNLSVVERSRSKSTPDYTYNRNRVQDSDKELIKNELSSDNLLPPPSIVKTAEIVKTNSRIPKLRSPIDTPDSKNNRRQRGKSRKTSDPSYNNKGPPSFGRSKSSLSVDPRESFVQSRSVSSSSLRRSTTPIGGQLHKTLSSSTFNSSESLNSDGIIVSSKWQMGNLDISKVT